MKVGFIGLGTMGMGMALNLAGAGTDLMVFDLNPEAVAQAVSAGARAAADLAEIASKCEVVFTSLPGPKQLEQVVFGAGGLLEHMRSGLVLFDLSTSSRSLACRIQQAFSERGGDMLDAPISGGPAGAASGDLTLWIGGDAAQVERHREILLRIGSRPAHVGPIGSGTVTKLAHNLMGYMIMQSMAEVFTMGVKAGMDPLDLWSAIRVGAVGKGSPLDMLTKQFLPGEFETPAFALELAHKDVTLANELGQELRVPLRIGALTLQEMTEALARGWNRHDSRAFLKLQVERARVEIAVDPARIAAAVSQSA